MSHQAFRARRPGAAAPGRPQAAAVPRPRPSQRLAARAQPALAAPALLRLLWLASPALPVGGFSYSEGLEAAVDAGHVADEASAGAWLRDQLALAQARSDLPLLAQAVRAWQACGADRTSPTRPARPDGSAPDAATAAVPMPGPTAPTAETQPAPPALQALNDWCLHTRESAELRQQTLQMGRSMADWVQQRHAGDPRCVPLAALRPAPTWPLAWALAAACGGAPLREALLAQAFGWCENMVQAAIKAVPLGQSAGQRLLAGLVQALPGAVDEALVRAAADAPTAGPTGPTGSADGAGRQNFSPMLAILSARHEAQYSRLFRS